MKKTGLLDLLAEQHRTFISNLRLLPELKWAALGDLYRMENKEQYPLKEWEEAVSYLWAARCALTITRKSGKASSLFPWR